MRARRPVVVTLGSLHADLIAYANHSPVPGLSTLGYRFQLAPGGKAANQAHQIARFGVESHLIARVGDDLLGNAILREITSSGINPQGVARIDGEATGASTIFAVDGEYQSIIVPGASLSVVPEDAVALVTEILPAYVVGQREIPDATTAQVFTASRSVGAVCVLNPSPLGPADQASAQFMLTMADVVIVNRHEAGILFGRSVNSLVEAGEAASAAREAFDLRAVAITCGDQGAVLANASTVHIEEARPVGVIDSIGAGDALLGGLVGAWALGFTDQLALRLGIGAATCSVQRSGGFGSMASISEIAAQMSS